MVLKNPHKHAIGKTIVYFVRHGETLAGDSSPNPRLTKKGLSQAKAVAKKFSKIKDEVDVFISSSMARALETAREIGKKINKKPRIHSQLSEFNQIVWKNKLYHYKFWKHYMKHRASLRELDNILMKNKEKVIVIVAHGNVIKGLIGKKLGLSHIQIKKLNNHNCHITLAKFKGTELDGICCYNSKDLVRP